MRTYYSFGSPKRAYSVRYENTFYYSGPVHERKPKSFSLELENNGQVESLSLAPGEKTTRNGIEIEVEDWATVDTIRNVKMSVDIRNTRPSALARFRDSIEATGIKRNLDRIQEKTGNEYLLILGGINQVPMPALFVVPSKFVLGVPSDELFVRENLDVKKLPDSQGGTAGEIFLSDSKPLEPSKIIISRIPLDAEETSSRPLAEALSKYSRERKRVIEEPRVLADECGHKDNCFLMKDTKEFLWTALFPPKDDCEEPFCLKSPPFCSETGCRKDDLLSALREADFLSVFEHGSGYGYYYVSKDGKGGTVLKPKEHFPQDFKSPAALVLSYACFGASIDFGYNNRRLTGRDSTALAFLRAGASSYVGTTRQGLAEVNNRLVLPLASEVFRAKKAVTLGEAFGIGKREIRKKAEGENEQLVAAMFVLYGDPTVRVVGASQ